MAIGEARTSRDGLLARAAAFLAVGALLSVVGAIFRLTENVESSPVAQLQITSALDVVGSLMLIPAFVIARAAFSADGKIRVERLRAGAFFAVGAYAITMISYAILGTRHDLLGRDVATDAAGAASSLALAAAACIAAVAFGNFSRMAMAHGRIARDRQLGWANVSLALGAFLIAITTILESLVDRVISGRYTSGMEITAVGQGVVAVAGLIAAMAFLQSRQHRGEQEGWLPRRGSRLGLAAVVLTVGFLIVMIGSVMEANAASIVGIDGRAVAGLWLDAVNNLAFALAAVCASYAFYRSRLQESVEARPASP